MQLFVFLAAALPAGAPPTGAAPPAAQPVGQHVGRWTSPPKAIESGYFPDAPILGNGDLGVSLGADPSTGELALYLGLNQLWGIREYDREANPSFTSDTALPRRLGLGKITLASPQLANASFAAEQHPATGTVNATLQMAGLSITVRAYLKPDENVLVAEVSASADIADLMITSSVLALGAFHSHNGSPKEPPMDGRVGSGVGNGSSLIYSERQPLGLSSPKPIAVAVATSLSDPTLTCSTPPPPPASPRSSSYDGVAACTGKLPSGTPLTVTAVVLTNWDLCGTPAGCAEPLPVALARAAALRNATAVSDIAAANAKWWGTFWADTWVSIPDDPLLEGYWYSTSYMIASASRRGSMAAGLWGPWVHCDRPGWSGDFTIDYNHFANHWGLYANNRIDQAWPQYKPVLDFVPKARKAASEYNCSGTHWPGHIAPFGFSSTLAGVPWASMSLQSNGALGALNMIAHWEYTQDHNFLSEIAFPFSRDALQFYQCWMTRRSDGSWINERDQAHECNPHGVVNEATKQASCYQNNSGVANGFVRRLASALPVMAEALDEPIDPHWLEIRDRMDPLAMAPLPHGTADQRVFTMAGAYTDSNCTPAKSGLKINSGNCGTTGLDGKGCTTCGAQKAGSMDVGTWHIFPGEATNLASSPDLLATSINSLRNDAPWTQGNSFCSVFSQAARVGMPAAEWLPHLHLIIEKQSMPNGVVYQGGGGVEVAGALQAISDIMLQSVTPLRAANETYMALFPVVDFLHSMSFHRLRGKGAFVISAGLDNSTQKLDGAVSVHSEMGGTCRLKLPAAYGAAATVKVVDGEGKAVPTQQAGLMAAFSTSAGQDYTLTAK